MLLLAQSSNRYVDQLKELMSDYPALVVLAVLLLVAVTVVSVWSQRFRLVVLTFAVYFSTLQRAKETPWYSLEMTPDMQFLSDYSRVFSIALLFALAVAAVFSRSLRTKSSLTLPVLFFFGFELLNCLKIASSGNITLAFASAATFTLVFLAVPIGVGKTLDTPDRAHGALLAIACAAGLVVLGTLYQLAVRPDAVIAGANPRLYATLGHPQKAGMLFALAAPLATFLTIHSLRHLWAKPLLTALAGLSVAAVGASGSRTALLALIVGGGLLLRKRLSLGILALVVVVCLGVGIVQQFGIAKEASARLWLTTNTRSEPWAEMIAQFRDNPIFGVNTESSGTGESSFLGAAARMGIIGIAAVSLLTGSVVALIYRLNKSRRSLAKHAGMADLVIGALTAIWIGCVFDQYLFDTITFFNIYIYLLFAIGGALLEAAEKGAGDALKTGRPIGAGVAVRAPSTDYAG